MKTYPSITNTNYYKFVEGYYHTFLKLDGSNIRAEYNSKQGWYKFGTRTQLLSEADPVFGCIPAMFKSTLSADLQKIIDKNHIKSMIVFMEFFGDNSFAGSHLESDEKKLVVFDAAIDKKGIVEPAKFIELFYDKVEIPQYLGKILWDREFMEKVKRGDITPTEGVVGKAKIKNQLVMVKAKTNDWLERIKKEKGEQWAKS